MQACLVSGLAAQMTLFRLGRVDTRLLPPSQEAVLVSKADLLVLEQQQKFEKKFRPAKRYNASYSPYSSYGRKGSGKG